MSHSPLVVSYGAGMNSTAMIVGMVAKGIRPDLILFADTGGEKPWTYEYISTFEEWLGYRGLALVTVRNDGQYGSLERDCLKTSSLPSLAFGWRSCSDKYKVRPQEKYIKAWKPAIEAWASGNRVVKAIGFGADETRRAKYVSDEKYRNWYPLIEWRWGRQECRDAIRGAGLPDPGKSACFFCPAMKKREILWLKRVHPDLYERAATIERKALASGLKTVKGLGRHWSWETLVNADEAQMRLIPDPADPPCMCFDGEHDND